MVPKTIQYFWTKFWMRYAGLSRFGRLATRFATLFVPPYKGRNYLRFLNPQGYLSPTATIHHSKLRLGEHVFVGDRVVIFEGEQGGPVELEDRVSLWGDNLLETGCGGSITIGADSRIQRGVQLVSYKAPILIGRDVGLSSNTALYSYDHGMAPGRPYLEQPLETKGPIIIDDHAWIGVGVIITSGVHIGRHAVIGAGSVVTHDVPDEAIAMGVPARVVKMRTGLDEKNVVAPEAAVRSNEAETPPK